PRALDPGCPTALGGAKTTMDLTRCSFLVGCCSAAAGTLGSGRLSGLAFGATNPGADILVHVFLRGAMDALSLVVPHGDPDYAPTRPTLQIAQPGKTRGALDLNGFFGLHPSCPELQALYQAGSLAVVVAAGSPDPTRSHFDAQASMEHGTPGRKDL